MTEKERNLARELWKVIIDGLVFYPENFIINDEEFSGFSDFSTHNQKVYQTEPSRSADFTMPDINDIITEKPPQLQIQYKYMNIDTFRRLKQATEKNEFSVEYYNFEYGQRQTNLMYIHPQDIPKFTTWTLNRLAALDQTLTFVATLNENIPETEIEE